MAIDIRDAAPLLQVFDIPPATSFYRDKIGFVIAEQSQTKDGDDCDRVLLKLHEVEIMLNTSMRKKSRVPGPDGISPCFHWSGQQDGLGKD